MSLQIHETASPTEADARQAWESLQQISHFLTSGTSDLSIRIQHDEQVGAAVILPTFALRLLKDILAEMAQGNAVAILPIPAELTTQQAADLLNVSRPYLIGLLAERKIPFREVGKNWRVRLDDLLAYRRRDNEDRRRGGGGRPGVGHGLLMVTPLTAIIDASVLYSAAIRDLVVRLAQAGLLQARWSDEIHEEWMRNLLQTTRESAVNAWSARGY